MTGPDGWIKNRGSMPSMLKGKRVKVRLRCGQVPEQSWPADTTRWTFEGERPFDVTHWKLAD